MSFRGRRFSLVLLPVALTLAGAVAAFLYARAHDGRLVQASFMADAERLHSHIDRGFNIYLESLRSMRYFYNSSASVDRAEFRTFTQRPLERHTGFVAQFWQPRVLAAGRATFEAEVRRGGFPEFEIRERDAMGGLRQAERRPEYLPHTFVEPEVMNSPALGFDALSEPGRVAAYEEARDSGEPAATGLVAPLRKGSAEALFVVAVPLFTHGPRPTSVEERRRRLIGYVSGAVALERVIANAINEHGKTTLMVSVEDAEVAPSARTIFFLGAARGAREAAAVSFPLTVPGRRWSARFSISPEEFDRRRSASPWAVLGTGLAAAATLAAFLFVLTGQAEAVEAEVQLRTGEIERQKTLLRSIIDNMGEGVAVADAQGKFLVFNAAAERIVGVGAVETGPEGWSDKYGVFRPDATTPLPPEENPLARALAGQSTDDVELFVRNPLVSEGVYIAVTSRPLTGPDGAPAGGVAVFRDVTARRRASDELRRAKAAAEVAAEAKAAFLANMSHEIRTPMNAVVGMAGLLQRTPLNEEQKDFVRTLTSAADGLLGVVNDILDFSRFEAGSVPLEQADFDLGATIHDALRILGPGAEAKGLDLAFYCDPSVPELTRGDARRLKQVLLNLVGNAVKFTLKGGVSVEARREDSPEGSIRIAVKVRDTGIGIAPEVQPALFSPFTQAESSTTRRFGGTGLGLAISKKIVEAMGGTISLASRLGEGSEFSFYILLKTAQTAARPGSSVPDFRGLRVIFADDNAVNRRILAEQLSSWGVESVGCDAAAACWERLTAAAAAGRPFGLLILDHHMPDEDGVMLARRVKADPALAATPMVLLSSAAISGEDPGFSARLLKPVNPSELFGALMTAIDGPRPRAATAPEPAEGRTYEHLKVLLVDDNSTNVKVASLQLSRLGVKPDTAGDGEQALSLLAKTSYDVVFMDCQMPVKDGFQAVKELRAREEAARRTVVVAMTANALEGDRETCLAAGMDDYLSKPATLEALAAVLSRWDAPLDPRVLAGFKELAAGAPEVLDDILATFIQDAPAALKSIRDGIDGGQPAQVKEAAHKLKGSAGSVGARRPAHLAGLLEATAKVGDLSRASVLASALEAALAETAAAIARERAR